MSPKKARSASVACLVDWSFKKLSIALTSVLSVRHSIAKAPCPTAGKQKLWGIISLIRSVYPRRVNPAAARIIASIWPSSSFRRRVSTLPRKSTIFRSGRAAKSWALRRRLEVPRTAPCGSVSIEAYLLLTKASPALARLVTAVKHRPSGRIVGISFRLWTARSISPSRRAVSSSLVKSPLPPILASGTSRIRSPLVMIFFKVTVHSGYCLRSRSAI